MTIWLNKRWHFENSELLSLILNHNIILLGYVRYDIYIINFRTTFKTDPPYTCHVHTYVILFISISVKLRVGHYSLLLLNYQLELDLMSLIANVIM